jgi:formate hydrogenlyase transcriptional activator
VAHAVLWPRPMSITEAASLETMARNLDQLPGQFVSALLRLEHQGSGRIVDDMLKQIGEALETDQIAFESFGKDGTAGRVKWVWIRPGSSAMGEPALTIPVIVASRRVCALSVGKKYDGQAWPSLIEKRLKVLADVLALAGREGDRGRRSAVVPLQPVAMPGDEDAEGADEGMFGDIIGDSPALGVALRRVLEVAPTDASVVLIGETGTGKELFARAVHTRSRRRGRPFVRVNCAALPPTLIESELFGHERGAFTGAVATRRGRFELAHTGTLFLDEIGDLPAEVQAKLLRVLQEGEFQRVGSSESRKVDVRIVAATHHDLDAAVKESRFRTDLYYRLSVFPIVLPPLRDRPEDIPRLVWFFINQRQRALNRRFTSIPPPVLAALQQHSWPGNVRELENVIERAMIHSTGNTLVLDEGPGVSVWSANCEGATLENVERRHIESVLRRCRWRINGPGNAADVLGLHPNTLRFRMKKLGMQRPKQIGMVVDVGRRFA